MTTEHCYCVEVTVSVTRTDTYEGYVCVPVGDEAYVDTYIANGEGFDWELIKDNTPVKPDSVMPNIDIIPFEYEVLYDCNADELED